MLLVMTALLLPAQSRAQEAIPEVQVKAAFVFNFIRFVEWPQGAFSSENGPMIVGVLGDDEFANKLGASLKDKKAHGRAFEVKKLTSITEASECNVTFVANSEARRATPLADATKRKPILLIGESDDFLESGGVINFVKDEKQLRFDINPQAAEDRKLVISSHLLRLARKTKKAE